MKKCMYPFLVLLSTSLFSTTSTPQKTEQVSKNETILIRPEADKTDIFAIPQDTSEKEEAINKAELDKLQKYEQAKKAKEDKSKAASDQSK